MIGGGAYFLPNVGVPIILDFIVCSARKPSSNERPSRKTIQFHYYAMYIVGSSQKLLQGKVENEVLLGLIHLQVLYKQEQEKQK